MKRIGLFSGTFDPIHIGHVEVALVALGACNLDEVLVMIEQSPTRKQGISDFKHRKAMVELALQDFATINLEQTSAKNITFDNSLPELQKKYKQAVFCLIIGSDMLEHLDQWPGAQEWLPKLELCVVLRDNKDKKNTQARLQKINTKNYKVLPAVWSPVSSSSVKRQLAKTGQTDALRRSVLDYINKHKLY